MYGGTLLHLGCSSLTLGKIEQHRVQDKIFFKPFRKALLFFCLKKNKSAKKRFGKKGEEFEEGKKELSSKRFFPPPQAPILIQIKKWCAARESNPHAGAKDPKSFVSANSTSRAYLKSLLI